MNKWINARNLRPSPWPARFPVGMREPDLDLRASIACHGILHAPRIARALRRSDRGFYIITGNARISEHWALFDSAPICCEIVDLPPAELAALAIADNIGQENYSRAELADALARAMTAHGGTPEEWAGRIGAKACDLRGLIQLREKLAPQLWALFAAHGESLTGGERALCALSHLNRSAQIEKWNNDADHSRGRRRGKARRPGLAKLARMLRSIAKSSRSPEWDAGAKAAILAALGRENWPLDLP